MKNNKTILDKLKKLLAEDKRLINKDDELLKNKIVELANKIDKKFIELLLSNDQIKEQFFLEVGKATVFDKDKFIRFVTSKEFLPDSYTAFKNKIGLTDERGHFIKKKEDVVLSWPYKDCVLEGGQTKEETKPNEIFWNQILAPDEITRLLNPKVFTNAKRIDAKDEKSLKEFKSDGNGNIKDNLIIKGNNLLVLHSLKERFAGQVKLIYIDPPFNTGNDDFNYNDRFNHSSWLTFMKNRLKVARDLLSRDGNIFIHIDINETHYLKTLCDEIFDRENFVEEIIWSYGSPSGGRAAGAKPVNIHNYILHYAKDYSSRKQNKVFTPYSEKYIKDWFKYTDKDGRNYQRRMRGHDEKGKVIWEKQYLDESNGNPLTTVWDDIKQVYADPRAYKESQANHTELIREFNGQKPEALIKRIFDMASDEGDLVLDFFAGTGTTGVVAHKTKRQYIIVEQMEDQVSIIRKRLGKIEDEDQTGISKQVDWKGGGEFVYMELAKWNENFVEQIKKAKSSKELQKLWQKLKEKARLSYKVDIKEFDKNADEFAKLSLEDQKHFLLETIDQNHLYINYSEIDDKEYGLGEVDKKLNKHFYKDN